MARKPRETTLTPLPEVNEEIVKQDMAAADALSVAVAGYSEERDLVNQLLGQAQMSGAFEQFSRTVRISKLAYVKENKLYRALRGHITPHGAELLSGTWEEFCELLGCSVDQADRDIANLRDFGEEALEGMSRMGIGYRELRQYRRLPEDEKTALIEVAKSGDKDAFVDLAESLIEKHVKEKEGMQADLKKATEDLEIKDRQLKAKDTKINEQDAELTKRNSVQPWDAEEPMRALDSMVLGLCGKILSEFNGALNDLMHGRDIVELPRVERQAIAAALGRVKLAVTDVGERFGIAPNEATDASQGVDEMDAIWAAVNAEMDAKEANDASPVQ